MHEASNFVRNELDRQMQSNNHQALNSFMELLYEVSQDPARSKRYDYIVLEFDGSRVADGYTAYEHEAEVAAFLKPYYDAKKVIWLVDNCAAGSLEPFGSMGTNGRKNKYYCPCTYFHNGNSHQLYEDFQYRGLIAFTDPDHYKSDGTRATLCTSSFKWRPPKDAKTYEQYRENHGEGRDTQTVYANDAYDIQIPYDDADGVSDYLSLAIKEKPYDLEFVDQIVDSGLEITAVHMSTSNVERAAADLNWLDVTDPSVVSIDINQAAHKVNAVVSNMCSEVWAKLDIDVRDTGSFRTGVDPVYDEDLGRLVATKDPNDGNGFVSKYDPGDDEPTAQGDSPTLEPWKYNVYVVTGLVVNGTLKIDGIETNEAFKAEGYDCSVTYRGDPGYALDSITVDGTPLTADEINEHLSDYGFTNIKADHEVVVVYTNFVVTSEPYTNYYDGAEHTIGVQLPDYHDDITDVKVQYSTDGETYVDTKPVYSNVEHTVVYYKVVGHQAGYGDEEITLATGSDTVDILPREVNVTAKSARKFYDGEELTAGYEVQHEYSDDLRAEGWGFVGTDDITTVKMTGESVIGADAAKTEKQTVGNVIDPDQTRFTSDEIAGNYIVHYTNGELEVIPVAVKPVVKVYDGAPTNVEVTVTDPPAGTTIRYSYAEDGGYAEAGELTFTGPTNAWESADVWVEVSAPGYGAVTNRASATILPRVVVEQAGSDTKAYDGKRLVCSNATERADLEAAKAAEVYEARGYTADFPEIDPADAAGFAEGEGFVAAADGNTYLRMTDDSWRLDVGEADNVIVATEEAIASELDDGTSCGNYLFFFENGLLEVTPATFTASAEPVEKFYDSTPTNIIVTVSGVPAGVTPTYEYSYSGTEGFVPAADFTGPTNVSESAEVWCRVISPGTTNVVSATATIKPRIVVVHAKDAFREYGPGEALVELRQPEYYEDAVAEKDRSIEIYGTNPPDTASMGFVMGEGFAEVPMTEDSVVTAPGTRPNVIDAAEVTLQAGTKPDNYRFFYLQGTLEIIQRQEEVRRDPEIPEVSKKVVEESDKKIGETLDEMAKADQETSGEPYVKYQLTVTPTNGLSEATRTTPERAAEDAKKQIELFKETVPDAKVGKVEFVDIVLERTYSKDEAEATAAGDYNKDNWDSLDKSEEHGNKLLEVTIPVNVPEGMELAGVTRSCDSKGTEILKPKDPNDPNAEGFVYDPKTKTITLYAYDFCVFGFMMKEKTSPLPPPPPRRGCEPDPARETAWVYQWKFTGKTTAGAEVGETVTRGNCGPSRVTARCAIRVPASLRIQGYTYFCNPGCSTDFFPRFAKANEVFWQTRPWRASMAGGVTTTLAHMIGRAHAKCEVAGTARFREDTEGATYVIAYAGFGKMAVTDARKHISSVSGNFAGFVDQAWMVNGRACKLAGYWNCVDLSLDCIGPTVVYGKWSATYKAAASQNYIKGKTVQLPFWVKPLNKK